MAPFLDFLTGSQKVREMGETAKRAARAQYDPSQLSPQLSAFREMATEGIEDEADIARRGAIQSLFRPVDTAMTGGNQGRALAMQQQQTQASTGALADLERSLSQADIQTRQRGDMGFAQTRTQQNQLEAQRDAAIKNIDVQTQAEIDRRKQALGSTVGSLAGTLAGSFLGPAGAAAAGALGGGVFGGAQGALSGAAGGAMTAMQRDLFGTDDTAEGSIDSDALADTARSGATGLPDDSPIQPEGLDLQELTFTDYLDMDLSGDPEAQSNQQGVLNTVGEYAWLTGSNWDEFGLSDIINSEQNSLFDVGQYDLREYIQGQKNKPTLEEFVQQQNLDAASQFQNYDTSFSFEEFENSWLGKGLYNFGTAANEFVSTFNPFLNLGAIRRGQQQELEEEYRTQYR